MRFARDRRGFIFFAYPKAASTSMSRLLDPWSEPGWSTDQKPSGGLYKHVRPPDLRRAWEEHGMEAEYRECFKFMIVRNPWSRMVSLYEYIKSEGYQLPTFRQWLLWLSCDPAQPTYERNQPAAMPAHEWGGLDDPGNVDAVFRMEDLATETPLLLARLGLPNTPMMHEQKTAHAPYDTYYDDATQALVGARYERDIERWAYSFR